jgi:hypothetical protein
VENALDIVDRVGRDHALELDYGRIEVTDGVLTIDSVPTVGPPVISGFAVAGEDFMLKVNSGGPSVDDFLADPVALPPPNRHLQSIDFFYDWAFHNFGPEVADQVSDILSQVDGNLHEPSQWVDGPGAIAVNRIPWSEVEEKYDFVSRLETVRDRVVGPGNRSRFDYWLNCFRFMRETARVGCRLGELETVMDSVKATRRQAERVKLARERALPLRRKLLQEWGRMVAYLLAYVDNPGDLGTVANLEQHSLGTLGLLTRHDELLSRLLGEPLPQDLQPWAEYRGENRLIVPTKRTLFRSGEALDLKCLILAKEGPERVILRWRVLGQPDFQEDVFTTLSRGVYRIETLPMHEDFEYFVRAEWPDQQLVFPATAPQQNHTVVVMELGSALP